MRNAFDIRTEKIYAREEGLAEGRAEGRAKGLAEGRAKGLAEGRAEGRTEGLAEGAANSRREIARRMISNDIDFAMISKCTGLSEDEIRAL